MMIINIRGTNGSGKSWVAQYFLTNYKPSRVYGVLGPRLPEANMILVPRAKKPLYILGPYLTNTGGCDSIQPYSNILDLLEKYSRLGHVLFEGSLVSDNYGKIGEWLEKQEKQEEDVLVIFLNTPLQVCLDQLRQRTDGAGEKHVAKRYQAIDRVRLKMMAEGKMNVLHASADAAVTTIQNMLR